MRRIYTGIDIGSDTIKMIVCEAYKNKYNVLATSSVKSNGVKKGLIVNAEEVIVSIKNCIKGIEEMLGVKIEKVIATVPSYFSNFILVEGYTTITNEEKAVTGNDIVRALQACVYNKLSGDRELVTIIPLEFQLDDKKGIKDPKGLIGSKLEAKAVMVTTPKKNIYSVVSVLENVGLEVVDITFGAIGDYFELCSAKTDASVGAIINIGDETTNVSIFNKGIIIKNEVLNIGGKNIDNDLAYIYKLSTDDAKIIKERFAVASNRYAQVNEIYNVVNLQNEELKLNQYEVSEVVMSRIIEILKLAKKQINLLTNKEINYKMVTGGVTEIPGFHLIMEEILGKDSIVANSTTIGIRHNRYSSLFGIVKYFNDKLNLRGKEYSMFNNEQVQDLISTKKRLINFSNDSVMGKVFSYFFDNN
jgi:cell division protein FtsA